MLEGEVLGGVLDEVDLAVHLARQIVLAHLQLEDEGLAGLAGNEPRIQTLKRGDQGIVTVVEATVCIDSDSDGHEAGLQQDPLSGFRAHRQAGHPGRGIINALHFAIQDARAFFDRLTQQKGIEPSGSAAPPAG